MESKRLQTAKKYIGHFATLDTETLASVLAANYVHEFAPKSMNPPGPFSKAQFLAHSASLRDIMTGFPVKAKEYVESESAHQVTVWATSKTEFRDEVKRGDDEEGWVYEGEYVFMLWMDESGEKVVRVVEFLDSKGTIERLGVLMRRARENKGMVEGGAWVVK